MGTSWMPQLQSQLADWGLKGGEWAQPLRAGEGSPALPQPPRQRAGSHLICPGSGRTGIETCVGCRGLGCQGLGESCRGPRGCLVTPRVAGNKRSSGRRGSQARGLPSAHCCETFAPREPSPHGSILRWERAPVAPASQPASNCTEHHLCPLLPAGSLMPNARRGRNHWSSSSCSARCGRGSRSWFFTPSEPQFPHL